MISKKVILTGSFGVGKTSLFNQFIYESFSDKYLTTIGVKVNKKSVTVGTEEVSILLWDIAGEVSQDKVPNSYLLGAAAVFYVFDLNRPTTYKNLETDLAHLRNLLPHATIRVVGNKKDLLTDEQLQALGSEMPISWDVLTSAKTGENVESLFTQLAQEFVAESK